MPTTPGPKAGCINRSLEQHQHAGSESIWMNVGSHSTSGMALPDLELTVGAMAGQSLSIRRHESQYGLERILQEVLLRRVADVFAFAPAQDRCCFDDF